MNDEVELSAGYGQEIGVTLGQQLSRSRCTAPLHLRNPAAHQSYCAREALRAAEESATVETP